MIFLPRRGDVIAAMKASTTNLLPECTNLTPLQVMARVSVIRQLGSPPIYDLHKLLSMLSVIEILSLLRLHCRH